MPDDDVDHPGNGFLNALTRMGERVAALEARTGAEIAALKRDTEAIRATGHDQANTLTKFISIMATNQETLRGHLVDCTKRGARLERIGYSALLMLFAVLGFLLQKHFWP